MDLYHESRWQLKKEFRTERFRSIFELRERITGWEVVAAGRVKHARKAPDCVPARPALAAMSDGADRRALDAQFPRPRLSQARALTAICLASILAPSTGWQAENRSPAPVFAASSSRLASDATWVGANGAGRTRILSRVSGVQDGLRLRGGGAWSSLAGMTSAVSNVFSAAKRSVWGTTSPLPMSPAKYNSGRDSPKRGGDESWNRGGGVKKERAMGRRWKDKRRGRGAQEAVQEADLEQAGKEEGAGPGAAGGAKGGGAQGGQKNRAGAGAPVVGQAGWEEGIEEGGAAGAKEAVQRRAPQGPRIARCEEHVADCALTKIELVSLSRAHQRL